MVQNRKQIYSEIDFWNASDEATGKDFLRRAAYEVHDQFILTAFL